jgi:hypothetical protein
MSGTQFTCVSAAAVRLASFLATNASAQSGIAGVVRDTSGAVLPGDG